MHLGRAPVVVASACRVWVARGLLFWGVWGCSGMSGTSGLFWNVWTCLGYRTYLSIWVVRDVLFIAGFMSLLPLSPLLVATTGRFCWLAVSASSKFGFPCQVQVQAQVEVQNAARASSPSKAGKMGGWDVGCAGRRRNLQDSSTRNTAPASNNKDIGQNRRPGFD